MKSCSNQCPRRIHPTTKDMVSVMFRKLSFHLLMLKILERSFSSLWMAMIQYVSTLRMLKSFLLTEKCQKKRRRMVQVWNGFNSYQMHASKRSKNLIWQAFSALEWSCMMSLKMAITISWAKKSGNRKWQRELILLRFVLISIFVVVYLLRTRVEHLIPIF